MSPTVLVHEPPHAPLAEILEPGDLARLRYEAQVVSWTRRLNHHGIDHVVLKGLGHDAWLDRTAVPRDLDILVPRWRLGALARLLRAEGYRRVCTEPTATTWVGPAGSLAIDVHDSLKAVGASHREVWSVFRSRRTSLAVANSEIFISGAGCRELHVAIHLAQAGLSDVRAHADFVRALAITPAVMWREADRLADQLGCRGLFRSSFSAVAEASDVRQELGFPVRDISWMANVTVARDHAMSLVAVSLQRQHLERARLAKRLVQLHPGNLAAVTGQQDSTARRISTYRQRFGELGAAMAETRRLHRAISCEDVIDLTTFDAPTPTANTTRTLP